MAMWNVDVVTASEWNGTPASTVKSVSVSLSAQRSSGKPLAPPPAACVNADWVGVSAGWLCCFPRVAPLF